MIHSFLYSKFISKYFNIYYFQVGDELPNINLHEDTPANAVNIREICNGKKMLLFAVPGAFTPGCSKVRALIV